jgi:membrane protein required for colicin V production
MNFLDIAVIGFTALSGLMAFSMGFVRVVLALLGWVGAIFTTMYLFHYVQPLARKWISIEILADGAAGLIIFISSLIIFTMISHTIGNRVRASGLSTLDRTIGLIFGFGLGTIIVSLGYIGMVWAMDLPREVAKQPQWIQEAKSRPFLKWGAAQLQNLAPTRLGFIPPTQNDTSKILKQRFEKLVTPETKKSANKKREGYNQKERREMDRLFKGQK